MSGQNRKRSAETSAPAPALKRTTPRMSTEIETIDLDAEKAKDESYKITATLSTKFDVFPALLRNRLQTMYCNTIHFQMEVLLSDTVPDYKYRYGVVEEKRVRSSNKPSITLHKDNMVSLSLANTTLLEHFWKSQKEALCEPTFVHLKRQEGLANPDFVQLHATRHGEIGWGFDTNGCLSLYLVYIDKGKLKEYVVYVQRAEFKVEEQL